MRSPHLDRALHRSGQCWHRSQQRFEFDVGSNLAIVDFCTRNEVDLVDRRPRSSRSSQASPTIFASPGSPASDHRPTAAQARRLEVLRPRVRRHDTGSPGPSANRSPRSTRRFEWLERFDAEVVVKADGLASGKGVIVPESRVRDRTCDLRSAGGADHGRCRRDGRARRAALRRGDLPVRDRRWRHGHVRWLPRRTTSVSGEGNTGLNTGGMGAFAPGPWR